VQELVTGHIGQVEIEKDQVRTVLAGKLDPDPPLAC
jgi:hypothetical protein